MRYPSITQIIDYFHGDWKEYVDKEVLKKSRDEGVRMHEMIAKAIIDNVVDDKVQKVVSWLTNYQQQLGNVKYVENRFVSEKYKVTGKPDLITDYALIDWKSSVHKEYCKLQMAGYALILSENGINVDAWIVYNLKTNKAYNITDTRYVNKIKSLIKKYKEEAYEY